MIYGIDVALPVVESTFPINEIFLRNIDVADSEQTTLIAVNRAGKVFKESCEKLCDSNDGLSLIGQCRNSAGCQIVGGIKNAVFYPFYTSDRNEGHLCRPRHTAQPAG